MDNVGILKFAGFIVDYSSHVVKEALNRRDSLRRD